MIKLTRGQLDDLLRVRDLRVVFTKADGTERLMECTRNFDLIPDSNKPSKIEGVEDKASTGSVMRVYDINAEGWRSFNCDNIENVEVI